MNLLSRVIRLPLRLVPGSAVVPILSGALRGKRWVAGASTNGCWLGTYEPKTQALLHRFVQPGSTVLDIGANVGFFTLFSSVLVGNRGRVIAFEPVPRNLELLKRHIALNAIKNIVVREEAVSDRAGSARFGVSASIGFSQGALAQDGDLEVRTVVLDELWRAGELPPPSLIKMDIEGGEAAALSGSRCLLRETRPTVVLSAHGWRQFEMCRGLFLEEGFDVREEKDGTEDGDYQLVATYQLAPR